MRDFKQFTPKRPEPVIGQIILPVAQSKLMDETKGSVPCEAGCGRYVMFRKGITYPPVPKVCVHCADWVRSPKGNG